MGTCEIVAAGSALNERLGLDEIFNLPKLAPLGQLGRSGRGEGRR